MDSKMKIFLDKIGISDESRNHLDSVNATLTKIKINKESAYAQVFITMDKNISLFVIKEIEEAKGKLDPDSTIHIIYGVKDKDLKIYLSYFPYALDHVKEELKVLEMYMDSLKIEDGYLKLIVSSKMEEKRLNKALRMINEIYYHLGYESNIPIELRTENVMDEIKKELDDAVIEVKSVEVKAPATESKFPARKRAKDENSVLGRVIQDKPMKIKQLIGEDNSVVVEGFVFGVDFFESAKTDFKIITLKITDYSDSIYCKVFVRDNEEFSRLKKELKSGNWYLFRGYTKQDTFARELVLNARDIVKLEKEDESISDIGNEKRVELHTHTKMSRMNGLSNEVDLVKQAIKWGHRAIAITDHNGIQSFPHVYNFVKGHNKKLEDGKDPFKVIYGVELTLIDDTVDIVIRPNDNIMLEEEYVVFDFETTGFNAGGADSIIEIGAVKIKDGMITDRFNELINPNRPLPRKIIEITHITDDMLKDKDSEENAMKRFIEWFGDCPMVAHNAKFDLSFLEMTYQKYNFGTFTNTVIDTLELSRTLDNNYARHSLSALVKRYEVPWDETAHHRADYDSEGTAFVFWKMLNKLDGRNIERMNELSNLVSKDEIHKYGNSYHVNILAKNKVGLKNLFKLVSLSNTKYLYKTPRILRSVLEEYREGLIIGSGCYEGEVFSQAKSKSEEELTNIIRFYDYVEVQPMDCYSHLVEGAVFSNIKELSAHLEKIIRATEDAGKLIVASGDVHHIKKSDKIYREIIVNQKVPGGGRHPLARYKVKEIPDQHFRTTDEMIDDFNFLDNEELVHKLVIENPNKIADMVDILEVIIDTGGVPFSPKIENSEEETKTMVYEKAKSIYGDPLPELILNRIEQELQGIIGGGFDVIYLISQKLVKKSNDDGYLVGSRGSVGSSFVATMMGITEVNPLPAHYVCKKCKYSEFDDETGKAYGLKYSSGYDLPDENCPKCNENLFKEGQDMPFATFLGFNADKVPDIDLNFSGDYQWKAHEYTKELFGIDNVYRAGTIGTVAEKTAFGFVKGYFEDKEINDVRAAEIERLAIGCTGVKRTTGQHPGGIVVIPGYMDVFDFTPFQYPADDSNSLWRTTHFDYHAIDENVLKLDILGHDDPTILRMLQDLSGIDVTTLPMDDKKLYSLLSSPEALGVTKEDILCSTGTLGLPELGTKFVVGMLEDTKPDSFSGLVKISGLSHGTDVWLGNASELINKKIVTFDQVIGCRDDIMVSLMNWGMDPLKSFKIMEFVRKGRASKDPEAWKVFADEMKEAKIPDWYIESCRKIKYMFPKAHACAYVMSAIRIAWFKLYKPLMYYAAYFSIRVDDFDIETMIKGYDSIKMVMEDIGVKGYEASNKEINILEKCLNIALEATARGIKFGNVSLEKSDATRFLIDEDNENTLIPPFSSIDGLGDTVAKTLVEERNKQPFLSKEDVSKRGKVSKTLIEKMQEMGVLSDLPDSNQLSLF